jgi:dTDP-4-dehydrorhamnose reductase
MRIAITGVSGQVGWELQRALQPHGEVVSLDRNALDLSRPETVRRVIGEIMPDVILNPAAYTAVDRAEQEPDLARRVNQDSVAELADAAHSCSALLLHYSTDYVFRGDGDRPLSEADTTDPQGVYGRTKLGGELALRGSKAAWLCFRTSWVYASRGKNFLRTILRLAREREQLRVVADQVGAPTCCRLIADASVAVLRQALRDREQGRFDSQILHLAAAGETSWHGFAEAIVAGAAELGMPSMAAASVIPITTAEYPTPARRPANSRLDCSLIRSRYGLALPLWRDGLQLCLMELAAHEWK